MEKEYLRRKEAAAYLTEKGLPTAPATLAKLASVGGGPVFHKWGRFPIYTPPKLDEYAEKRLSPPLRSTSELEAAG